MTYLPISLFYLLQSESSVKKCLLEDYGLKRLGLGEMD